MAKAGLNGADGADCGAQRRFLDAQATCDRDCLPGVRRNLTRDDLDLG